MLRRFMRAFVLIMLRKIMRAFVFPWPEFDKPKPGSIFKVYQGFKVYEAW